MERANATLQDRLVKELRLSGISTIDDANAFAPTFIQAFNERFGRPALNAHDAHRPLRDDEHLPEIFTWQEMRKLSRSLTLHYKRVMYVLDDTPHARAAVSKHVEVCETEDGEISLWHGGRELKARAFDKTGFVHQAAIVENKHLAAVLTYAKQIQEQRAEDRLQRPDTTKRDRRLMQQKQTAAASLTSILNTDSADIST